MAKPLFLHIPIGLCKGLLGGLTFKKHMETATALAKGPKKAIPQAVSFQEIEAASKHYPDSRDRFLFDWLYLTGQRVSEALVVTRSAVKVEDMLGKKFMVVDSITLKNKQQPRRTIPVPMFGFEKEMCEKVWASIENLRPETKLCYFSRYQAFHHLAHVSIPCQFIRSQTRERFDGLLQVNPHFLRHCRATHMEHNHGFDSVRLMQFFGWASGAMPNTYITTNARDLMGGFIHD